MGNRYLRRLLYLGAIAQVSARRRGKPGDDWLWGIIQRKKPKQAAIALANRMICEANCIEHRLTKPNHPWTNGQVERMNRTIKDATVKRFRYTSHDELRTHLADFMAADNSARRLKTLGGLTP